nr:ABC transporter ATP-binding protein [Ornithinimicrobium sp. F0845]
MSVRGLSAGYPARRAGEDPTTVLDGIDLEVETGAFVAVLGPSGCGKTTLLRVIAGLHPARSGQIELAGRPVVDGPRGVPPEQRRIGLVPQEAALFPHQSVAANVAFGLRSPRAGVPRPGRAQRDARVAQMLDLVGLPELGGRLPHELSGGQRQRVALARALAPGPTLVLLDEPFGALDASLRVELRTEVRQILRETGTTTVLVTHDQDEALSTADQVVVLRDGRIVQQDSPDALYAGPVDEWVARFVGDCTILPGTSDGSAVRFELGTLPAQAPAGPVEVVVRPEQVLVGAGPQGVSGVVAGREFFGHDTLYHLELATGTRLLARMSGAGSHDVGSTVSVGVAGPVQVLPIDRG